MTYIATFFSHFGAIRFKKRCDENHWPARIMPVPRNLSSSCGTCVRYEGDDLPIQISEELEQIVQVQEDGYLSLYRTEES